VLTGPPFEEVVDVVVELVELEPAETLSSPSSLHAPATRGMASASAPIATIR
jgi:hypothetical protein